MISILEKHDYDLNKAIIKWKPVLEKLEFPKQLIPDISFYCEHQSKLVTNTNLYLEDNINQKIAKNCIPISLKILSKLNLKK
jgi:hypothetical protein